jgi:hypothetical protein
MFFRFSSMNGHSLARGARQKSANKRHYAAHSIARTDEVSQCYVVAEAVGRG